MRFPVKQEQQHYFPVAQKTPPANVLSNDDESQQTYIVGLDQTIVDIEANVSNELLTRYNLIKGSSQLLSSTEAERLYGELSSHQLIIGQHAGGTIGNTLHNYSVLAEGKSILFGVMSNDIRVGNYAYRYLCGSSSNVDLQFLQPVTGAIGRAFTLISEDGERTFAIDSGMMNRLKPDAINESLIKHSSAFLVSAYFSRCSGKDTLDKAAFKAIEYANKHNVPVVLTLGTRFVIAEKPTWWREFIKQNVQILAMNEEEADALFGIKDPLLACEEALNYVDLVLCTAGSAGLYMAGYADEASKCLTDNLLLSGAIAEFNKYELSRPVLRSSLNDAMKNTTTKIYSHMPPYMGGPDKIKNTNGAGDAALSAVLHDIAANAYHKMNVANSSTHQENAMTYSALSQMCQYANRVSYEVLSQHSPRLSKGLSESIDG